MLWFKLKTVVWTKPMFLRPNPLLHQELSYNCVIHKDHVLQKHHVLAGPLQGLFASCRITLSMVAGRTRRRRLNISWSNPHTHMYTTTTFWYEYIYAYDVIFASFCIPAILQTIALTMFLPLSRVFFWRLAIVVSSWKKGALGCQLSLLSET